jgi:hypothetical protein
MEDSQITFKTIIDMRNTLYSLKENLTPYSGKMEHQRYLDSVKHYKKILLKYISRVSVDLDTEIEKSTRHINNFIIADIATIKGQILDGRH